MQKRILCAVAAGIAAGAAPLAEHREPALGAASYQARKPAAHSGH